MTDRRRALLEGLQARLELAMDEGASPSTLPNLAREYRAVLAELDELPAAAEGTVLDEFSRRRRARGADTAAESGS